MGKTGLAARPFAIAAALALLIAACSASAPPPPEPSASEAPLEPLPAAARSSRIVVTDDALWAGHPASRTVTKLALPGGALAWQTAVGCEPGTLAPSASRLYVACTDTGEVVALDASSGIVLQRARIGHGAFGILAARARLYVTLAHDDELAAVRADTLAVEARVRTGREPRGLAIRSGVLYVVHHADASVRSYEVATLRPLGASASVPGWVFAESITPSPLKDRLYVPHQRQMTANMARRFDNTLFPLVTSFDAASLGTIRSEELALDALDTPVALPIASVIDPVTGRLYVANAISSDISVIDLATGFRAAHVLVGDHPRDLALSADGTKLYTLDLVSDGVTVVDTAKAQVIAKLALATDPRSATLQRGERLFMVSRPETLSRDRWMTCASCHLDGGNDGQTWLGEPFGPRNTPILRGVQGTQPLHWSGDLAKVQDAQPFIQGQMGGTGISDAELEALAAYIDSLTPIASPARTAEGKLTPEALRGASVFGSAGCAECHVGPLMTDRQLRDVGTGAPTIDSPLGGGKLAEKRGSAYKTPPLRELWLTAPYLHDGRAKTLREVLTTYNADDRHGTTSRLSDRELGDLEAFLLALPLADYDREQLGTR